MVQTRAAAHARAPNGAADEKKDQKAKLESSKNQSAKNSEENGPPTKKSKEVKDEPAADTLGAGDKHGPADASQPPEDRHKRQKTEGNGAAHAAAEAESEGEGKADGAPAILEKGNIYFFLRGRVNVEEPRSLDDVARTYIVLRPLAEGDTPGGDDDAPGGSAKKGRGGGGGGHCRLLALPKKVLPRTGRERYLAFVEKADASYAALESEFLAGGEYETKTARKERASSDDDEDDGDGDGDAHHQHVPVATAFGEGVYAIISTGRESHLAYLLTVPEELGEVQRQMGLAHRQGCFIVSTKNPAYPMQGGAKMVGGGPDYPKAIQDSFRSLRWAPLRPEHLDYANSHLLLIGESAGTDKIFGADGKPGEAAGRELSAELEEFEDDDLDRMRRLGSTEAEAIYASLEAKDQPRGQPELAETFG